MNHVRIYGHNRFWYSVRHSFYFEGRTGTKTLRLTYPHTEKSRGLKSGDRGGQAIVPPRPIKTIEVGSNFALQEWNAIWRFELNHQD
jgi:hypothetical protein